MTESAFQKTVKWNLSYLMGKMVYPLSQHIGAPAKPIVKKGDAVLKGQMIAEAGGFVSRPGARFCLRYG